MSATHKLGSAPPPRNAPLDPVRRHGRLTGPCGSCNAALRRVTALQAQRPHQPRHPRAATPPRPVPTAPHAPAAPRRLLPATTAWIAVDPSAQSLGSPAPADSATAPATRSSRWGRRPARGTYTRSDTGPGSALTNSNALTRSNRSPEQTRPLLLTGSPAPSAAAGSPVADAPAPPSRDCSGRL